MLTCFTDTVGLYHCAEATEPTSGLYLNTLPGISIEAVDNTANSEQITYLGVFKDVQTNAQAQFFLDIRGEINKCYRISKDCSYETLICDNQEVLYQAWKYLLGVHIMIARRFSSRLNWFTTVALEEAKTLQDMYQVEYEAALKQAVQLMDTSECCLTCDPLPRRAMWLP